MHSLEKSWYQSTPSWRWAPLTVPLTGLYAAVSSAKRLVYTQAWITPELLPVPVVVVGNIVIGGTGKTPFTLWLVEQLLAAGLKPGIVSRGYGGKRDNDIMQVLVDTPAEIAGDEPVMLAQRGVCPVVVGKKRPEAASYLLEIADVDVIIADDGLQHYRLDRAFEIALMDGQRGLGNGWLMPMGPLRERASRLSSVDAVVMNGDSNIEVQQWLEKQSFADDVATMQLIPTELENVLTGERMRLADAATKWADRQLVALAGIGNPTRFFKTLQRAGLVFAEKPLPDHHAFTVDDVSTQQTIIMTEKDAVKCRPLAKQMSHLNCWMLPVQAALTPAATQRIMQPLLALLRP